MDDRKHEDSRIRAIDVMLFVLALAVGYLVSTKNVQSLAVSALKSCVDLAKLSRVFSTKEFAVTQRRAKKEERQPSIGFKWTVFGAFLPSVAVGMYFEFCS